MFDKVKKKILSYIRYVVFLIAERKYRREELDIKVMSIEETLETILNKRISVSRFGDGEVALMLGENIKFQHYNEELAKRMTEIISSEKSNDVLVCIPDIFFDLNTYTRDTKRFWGRHRQNFYDFYYNLQSETKYGNAFISRPYFIFENKKEANKRFNLLKQLWSGRDILIVEGENSKSGVGNDLFLGASSITRVICPSQNAYNYYDEILNKTIQYGENKIILLMLGPTASVLSFDLERVGLWAIDLGHIDSEYEWFKMSATEKVRLTNKHTAEFDDDVSEFQEGNEKYENEIIYKIGFIN